MHRKWRAAVGGLAVAWVSLAGAAAAQEREAAETWVRIAVPEWAGFAERAPDGQLRGGFVDFANVLCAEMRIRCDVRLMSFPRVLEALAAGQDIDMAVAAITKTPEREALFLMSAPFGRSSSSFVTLIDSFHDTSPKALAGKRIGVIAGSMQAVYAKRRYGAAAHVVERASLAELFAFLPDGKVDVVLAPTMPAMLILNRPSSQNLEIVGTPIVEEGLGGDVAMGLPFGRERLRDSLNEALHALQSDGRLNALRMRSFPSRLY